MYLELGIRIAGEARNSSHEDLDSGWTEIPPHTAISCNIMDKNAEIVPSSELDEKRHFCMNLGHITILQSQFL